MSDDVKVLREAAEALMHTQTIGHTVGASRLALSVCFRTMADMIERESAQEPASQSTGHPIEQASYDEGWNEALSAVLNLVGLPKGFSYQDTWTNEQLERLLVGFGDRVRALRREPRT